MTDDHLHRPLIGQPGARTRLNTPVLAIDRDALDRNIRRMADFAAAHGLALRPHAKTHKSIAVAKRQLAAGAIGLCCAKIGEAEALGGGGITGLHITSPVVSAAAIDRLVTLNQASDGLMCVVDHPDNVRAIAAAIAARGGRPLDLIIDVDPGIRRTGVPSPEAAVAAFEAIRAEPGLVYRGVQYYCGVQQHIEGFAERDAAIRDRADYLRTVIAALTAAGGAPEIVTGGGTGTHRIDATLDLFTELQVGSYIFMDDQYRVCDLTGDATGDGGITPPFEQALMVEAGVVSANSPGLVTLDAGFKAFATDAAPPTILSGAPEGSKYLFMGDEHGALLLGDGPRPALGDHVVLSPPHCDPTVNLYDHYHVMSGDTLVDIWRVDGRGRSR